MGWTFLLQITVFVAATSGVQGWMPARAMNSLTRLRVSTPPSSSSDATAADLSPEEEEEQETENFLETCQRLCDERNLSLDKVKNCRDLSSVQNSPIRPNRIYRMGRLSDASEDDIELLLRQVNLNTIVDLRSPTELKDDPTLFRSAVFQNFTNLVWKEQGRGKPGCVKELPPGKSPVKNKRFQKRSDGTSSSVAKTNQKSQQD